jgi:ABC-type branched-subunit amino acid transport system substrate-binding protein
VISHFSVLAVLNIALAYAKAIGILNQWEYSAQIAINHAVQDEVLPGYSINLIVVNTQAQESVAVRGALEALSTVRPHAFIGGTLNPETIALQYVLKGAQVPQIGPTASSEQLARRDSNPYFMRPIASEYDEAKSILSLMQKYDWSNVAIIVSDDDVGSGGSDALDRAFLGPFCC